MRKFIVFYSLFSLIINVYGQDNATIDFIKKVNAKINSSKSVKMDMRYSYYDSHSSTVSKQTEMGKYIKFKDGTYSHIESIEGVFEKGWLLSINHSAKIVTLSKKENFDYNSFFTVEISDTALSKIKGLKMETLNDSVVKITYPNSSNSFGASFAKVELFVVKNNFSVTKVIIYYNEMQDPETDQEKKIKPRVEIEYLNSAYSDAENAFQHPSVWDFISKNREKFSLKEKLKGYRFQNIQ